MSVVKKIDDAIFRASFTISRFLTDSHFLDITPKETASDIVHKAASGVTKAKKSVQKSALDFMTTKNAAGDYEPKPPVFGKIMIGLAQESLYLMGKVSPALPRVATSPVLLGVAFAGAAFYLAYDDTARMMLSEQFGNVMAVLQSDDTIASPQNDNTDNKDNGTRNIMNPTYQRPNYYV